ncbi:Hsp20/alpha crystallin family protein [Achromobacter deleyi]|jgi:HSP20 family protein|uniref:Hsp20/alpha crystallin family protein n=1 Tax=Achromobacter deleyi TaxID=1353891 RepID=UPI0014918D0E|nr:Hsp20/alpha crystallin family protein [Achromobacter deleyi]QVQ25771.1 Hsp20/alpha crystallin family protein [Achromobacter deleyi]UIP21310.1 Hsp20/alpha crystallin family protein [Achromobacter deleyi]
MSNFPFSDSGFAAAFDAIQEHMGRVLRGAGVPAALRATPQAYFPPVNVGVSGDSIEVVAFVPGMEPDALNVSIEKRLLTISGERKAPELPENARYYARERAEGRYMRVIELPADADPDNVQARYTDGCLAISIKRKESAKPRVVTVQ